MRELGRQMAGDALTQARTRCAYDHEFELDGRRWYSPAGVVGSEFNTSTGLLSQWLPVEGVSSMLEMGCGCGVASVTAALAGCPQVVAVDVNPHAVAAAAENARRHGVEDRVTTMRSDLFDAVDPSARFDVLFWNSPFVDGEVERAGDDDFLVDHFFDPGYALHDRFLTQVPERLTDRGRAFLGFSAAMADEDALAALADRHGLVVRPFRSESFGVPHTELGTDPVFLAAADADGQVQIDFSMLELTRAEAAG